MTETLSATSAPDHSFRSSPVSLGSSRVSCGSSCWMLTWGPGPQSVCDFLSYVLICGEATMWSLLLARRAGGSWLAAGSSGCRPRCQICVSNPCWAAWLGPSIELINELDLPPPLLSLFLPVTLTQPGVGLASPFCPDVQ